jgi:hypothetical protein
MGVGMQYLASETGHGLCHVQSNKFGLVNRALFPAAAESISPFEIQDSLLSVI